MQMGRAVFLKLQNANIIDALTKLPAKVNAHFAPAVAEIAIRPHTIPPRDTLRIESQSRHFVKFLFGCDAGDFRTDSFQLGITATVAAVGTTEQAQITELSQFAF